MQIFHGAHSKFELHVGQGWTDVRGIAEQYAGSGVVVECTIDMSDLLVEDAGSYDWEPDEATGDRG